MEELVPLHYSDNCFEKLPLLTWSAIISVIKQISLKTDNDVANVMS